MNYIDLQYQYGLIQEELNIEIQKVLKHGQYIMGPEVIELENKLAEYVGVKYAISCSSGTDALLLSLMAHNVKPGDKIYVPSFTFAATAEVVALLGAIPIFVDIDPITFNIDLENLKETIRCDDSPPGKGIIAVNMFGLPANYDEINDIAHMNHMFVIEDAAQSFGASYNNKRSCSLSDVGCTSFFPAKPLGCYGDGGMCFTNYKTVAEKIKSLRVHGKGEDKYDNVRVGINGRLDTIQAAILLAKFKIFDNELKLRQEVAEKYDKQLENCTFIQRPVIKNKTDCVWAQYSLLAKCESHRAEIMNKLKSVGIPTMIYYPKPLHQQIAYKKYSFNSSIYCPNTESICKKIFSIPMYPYLTDEQIKLTTDTIKMCKV